jgi:hypothetical protein
MKKQFLFLACCFFLASCLSDEVKIPEGVIPRDQMVAVLADVQIAESVMSYKDSRGDITISKAPDYYQFIFSKYHITEKQFRKSFTFYSGQIEMMDKIYEDVIIEISKRQALIPGK